MSNDKPASETQKTRREPGFYHIKIRQYGPRGADGHEPRIADKWTIAIWDGRDFEEFNELYHEDEVVEIDERRIERQPSSESSHSPTEQPGDASCFSEELTASDRDRFRDFVMLHMEMGMQSNPASFARHALEWATKYERAKQAELVAENERLKDVEVKLRDAYEYMKKCAENLERGRDALQSENANQSAELEQLRSERDKLRQENERYKEALQCMMNVEHHGDFMNAFFDLKDQVKAARQGE